MIVVNTDGSIMKGDVSSAGFECNDAFKLCVERKNKTRTNFNNIFHEIIKKFHLASDRIPQIFVHPRYAHTHMR